jgi:hypothetical protein
MAEKFELLPTDIDLTERNVFGRSSNEFHPKLEDTSMLPDGIEAVERRISPAQNIRNAYRRWNHGTRYSITSTSTTNNFNNIDTLSTYYTNMTNYISIQPVVINATYDDNADFISSLSYNSTNKNITSYDRNTDTIQLNIDYIVKMFKILAEEYIETGKMNDDIDDLITNISHLFPMYVKGHLCNIKTVRNYINTSIDDSIMFTASSSMWENEYNEFDVELEPSCISDLEYSDIDKCYKDEYALIIGKSASYINKVYRWCEILKKIVPPGKKEIQSVDLNRYREFNVELDSVPYKYNALEDYHRYKLKYYTPYPGILRYNLSRRSAILGMGLESYGRQYSELPGLYVSGTYIVDSHPDVFRHDSYPDRGTHLLEIGVPRYTVIEYDLENMEAIEPDEYERWPSRRTHDEYLEHEYYEKIIKRKE